MQCKARNRPCTFYKDGSFDPDQETPDNSASSLHHSQHQHRQRSYHSDNASSSNTTATNSSTSTINPRSDQYTTINTLESPNESCYLFADTNDGNAIRSKRRGPPLESRTSNTLASLGEGLRKVSLYDKHTGKTFADAEPYGSFIKWIMEPPLPSRYSGSIEMPSRESQMEMLELFFRENYEVLPIIPRRYFFEQLQCKGPIITPLLLNAIYAQTSRYMDTTKYPDLPKPEVFFHRAKRLIDDFMDAPRISTVVALCYMSLYEPSPSTHRSGSPFCRSWMYSGMAYRMCLELGLHNQANISKELGRDEVELRKRVFWSCYCLDKVQSGGWERPWMITKKFALVDIPCGLPDDDADEKLIIENLKHKIKFAQICEDALLYVNEHLMNTGNYSSLITPYTNTDSPTSNNNNTNNNNNNSNRNANNNNNTNNNNNNSNRNANNNNNGNEKEKLETFQNSFSDFVRSLPAELQWTPTSTLSVDDVLRLPVPRPMVMHLHLVFNQCILDQLLRSTNNAFNQFQRRINATCITQLVHFMCDRPASIIKYDLIIHSLLSAIKVHVRHLYSSDIGVARQSWAMFDRSILAIHKLRRYAAIPNSAKFLQQLGSTVEGYEIPDEVMASVAAAATGHPVTSIPLLEQQQQHHQQQLFGNRQQQQHPPLPQQHQQPGSAAGPVNMIPVSSTPTPIIPMTAADMTNSDDVLSRMYLGQQSPQQRTHPQTFVPPPPETQGMSAPPEENNDYVVMSMNHQQHHAHSHQPAPAPPPLSHPQQQDWTAAAATPLLQPSSSSSPTSQATLHGSIIIDPITAHHQQQQGGLMSPSLATARKNNTEQFIQLRNPNDLIMGKYTAPSPTSGILYDNPSMPPPQPPPPSTTTEQQQRTLWHYQD
ncbi:fungal-specific transcription factor domain-containing protein [Phascolomyces articulosus]|uniref:Fungal-specific transcription factor domain-containing protein n=1 Tax=Phascolomyces articulosus TaxID=60185 RepID=A0AAD5KCT8_9FUNG|nr:fungal-specific transcription factor domain-containing protein [Phascolomyces articulosus]